MYKNIKTALEMISSPLLFILGRVILFLLMISWLLFLFIVFIAERLNTIIVEIAFLYCALKPKY